MAMDIVDRLRCVLKGHPDAVAAADEIVRLRTEVSKWRGLADANAGLAKVQERRHERDGRLGLVPNLNSTTHCRITTG